jgi:hypothetical protein
MKKNHHHAITTLDLSIYVTQCSIDLKALNLPHPSEAFATFQASIRKEREILHAQLEELEFFDKRGTEKFMAYRKLIATKKLGDKK